LHILICELHKNMLNIFIMILLKTSKKMTCRLLLILFLITSSALYSSEPTVTQKTEIKSEEEIKIDLIIQKEILKFKDQLYCSQKEYLDGLKNDNDRHYQLLSDTIERIFKLLYFIGSGFLALLVGVLALLGVKGFNIFSLTRRLDKLRDDLKQEISTAESIMSKKMDTLRDVSYVAFTRDLEEEEAINVLQQIAQKESGNQLSNFYLGRLYHKKKEYDNAISCFEKIIQLQPDFWLAWERLGYAYNRKDMPNEAVRCFLKVLENEPSNIRCLRNLAYSYSALKDYTNAIKYSEKALQINPNYTKALNNMGYASLKMNLLDKAYSCFCKAIELDPDYDYAYYNLMRYYVIKEDYKKALEYFRKIIKLGYSNYNYLLNDEDLQKLRMDKQYSTEFLSLIKEVKNEKLKK